MNFHHECWKVAAKQSLLSNTNGSPCFSIYSAFVYLVMYLIFSPMYLTFTNTNQTTRVLTTLFVVYIGKKIIDLFTFSCRPDAVPLLYVNAGWSVINLSLPAWRQLQQQWNCPHQRTFPRQQKFPQLKVPRSLQLSSILECAKVGIFLWSVATWSLPLLNQPLEVWFRT